MGLFDSSSNSSSDKKINSVTVGTDSPFDNDSDLDILGIGPVGSNITGTLLNTLSRTNDMALSALDMLRGLQNDVGDVLSPLTLGISRVNKYPNEIISTGIPPPEIYEECKHADGLAVWDQRANWHCLFPKSKIPYDYGTGENNAFGVNKNDSGLSREDIENDVDHKYGIYFKSLEELLGWQASMRRAVAEQNRRRWNKWQSNELSKWTGGLNKFDNDDNSDENNDGKSVVGQSSETRVITLDNGDVETTTYRVKTYSDGTKKEWKNVSVVGPDGTPKN
ncbi:hypothetical protein DAPK24_029760 [Pichia kluyveri]|uniref:Mitochondrial peculiar membrane protein 1 n=1 Tax=Pichia kluyveri TaxID=36015 RepID=A0AAV5R555_PICKL|nr:hypothetical protein DAPK24_029760 [Pichia kluyveri]